MCMTPKCVVCSHGGAHQCDDHTPWLVLAKLLGTREGHRDEDCAAWLVLNVLAERMAVRTEAMVAHRGWCW